MMANVTKRETSRYYLPPIHIFIIVYEIFLPKIKLEFSQAYISK